MCSEHSVSQGGILHCSTIILRANSSCPLIKYFSLSFSVVLSLHWRNLEQGCLLFHRAQLQILEDSYFPTEISAWVNSSWFIQPFFSGMMWFPDSSPSPSSPSMKITGSINRTSSHSSSKFNSSSLHNIARHTNNVFHLCCGS